MIAYFYAESLGFDLVQGPADELPAGSVEVGYEDYLLLLEMQAMGKRIAADDQGFPLLVDPPGASVEVLVSNERVWRDGQLAATDGVVSRHRDELEEGLETTLTPTQYTELQAYRRALRNWPEAGEFPLIEHRPPAPPWLTEQI